MPYSLINLCSRLLTDNNLTIAFAECSTGGRITSDFSTVSDATSFLKGGLICFDNAMLEQLLSIPKEMIENYTPESSEVAEAITYGLRQVIDADIHIGITGLIKPAGNEHYEKPIGTMFVHSTFHGKFLFSKRYNFQGDASTIITQTTMQLAYQLRHELTSLLQSKVMVTQ